MTIPSVPAPSSRLDEVGGWLFRHRTSLPIPIAVALLLIPPSQSSGSAGVAIGVALVLAGETLRLWGVRHIGAISRTRSDRLGPLVTGGPFGRVRNPLYIGNVALWVGFALAARITWLAPVILVLLGFEYHAIVRWEERLLDSRRGSEYRAYMARVPRWLPALSARPDSDTGRTPARGAGSETTRTTDAEAYSWRETLSSERGTLIAIAAGFLLLWSKAVLWR